MSAPTSPGHLLWLMSNKWQAQQRLALKPFDLTHVQFVLLATLVYGPDDQKLTQIQLAERAEADPMMTSQVVRKLEGKGLVQRTSSADDKRAFNLEVTNKGIELTSLAMEVVEAVDDEFFEAIEADMPDFVEMMQKLVWASKNLSNKKEV